MDLQRRFDYQRPPIAKTFKASESAVLRMLQEEEESNQMSRFKRVAWPPPPEENTDFQLQEPNQFEGSGEEFRSIGTQQQPFFGQSSNKSKEEEEERKRVKGGGDHNLLPKSTVTLLESAPIRQEPPPVFASQPVAISIQGGARMRGDQKWPPESVKQQSEAENAARIALAKGPACRPRKVKKDYSAFFAQHALNPTYPGYKAPPGTQHYIEEGTSNL